MTPNSQSTHHNRLRPVFLRLAIRSRTLQNAPERAIDHERRYAHQRERFLATYGNLHAASNSLDRGNDHPAQHAASNAKLADYARLAMHTGNTKEKSRKVEGYMPVIKCSKCSNE